MPGCTGLPYVMFPVTGVLFQLEDGVSSCCLLPSRVSFLWQSWRIQAWFCGQLLFPTLVGRQGGLWLQKVRRVVCTSSLACMEINHCVVSRLPPKIWAGFKFRGPVVLFAKMAYCSVV